MNRHRAYRNRRSLWLAVAGLLVALIPIVIFIIERF